MRPGRFRRRRIRLRRPVIVVLLLGMIASLLAVAPAAATGGGGKYSPSVTVRVQTNDDGRPGRLDPHDVGDISAAYDRWGPRSSDDPDEVGMTPTRTDSDVARCKASRKDRETFRVTIQNAYPGYACTFRVVTINRAGVNLIVDEVSMGVDPTLDLISVDGPSEGDVLRKGRRIRATYGVIVNQETPQQDSLEFDVVVSYVEKPKRIKPSKCWHRRWR